MFILSIRGLNQRRYKVLEMDLKGNLYLRKNALLCKYEIIKRLTSGKYNLEEENPIGNYLLYYVKRLRMWSPYQHLNF